MNLTSISHRFILSDLHIAEGTFRNKFYYGTENFTKDLEFSDLVDELLTYDGKKEIIINGDFVDFIRITDVPQSKQDIDKWEAECQLAIPGIQIGENCIDCREKKYGLKTNDYKSIWKLYTAFEGHPLVFQALKKWVINNNVLRIIEGNHDPEWCWPKLQNYFRKKIYQLNKEEYQDATEDDFNEIYFNNDLDHNNSNHNPGNEYYYDPYQGIRIIHGHDVDPMTAFDKQRVLSTKNRDEELTLPIGSFFNRYIINAVEFEYPYLDNVKPTGAIITSILKDNYVRFLVYIFSYIPYLVKMVFRFKSHYALQLFYKFLFPGIPIILAVWLFIDYNNDHEIVFFGPSSGIFTFLLGLIPFSLKGLFNGGRTLLGMEPKPYQDKIIKYAKENNLDTIIVGHNHKPEIKIENNISYLNSGSWTYSNEVNGKIIRTKELLSFVHLTDDKIASVKEWNPFNKRIEPYHTFSTSKKPTK